MILTLSIVVPKFDRVLHTRAGYELTRLHACFFYFFEHVLCDGVRACTLHRPAHMESAEDGKLA